MKLIVEVIEIKGTCPVYTIGDRIVLDNGYKVNLGETDNICLHSLASLLPYYNALVKGVNPVELGLALKGKEAYIQCLDPQKYTGGGTVTFKVSRTESRTK
ncbi:MAG: TIGR04076 family protein [Candidatus Aminicenantaceae bacterium]